MKRGLSSGFMQRQDRRWVELGLLYGLTYPNAHLRYVDYLATMAALGGGWGYFGPPNLAHPNRRAPAPGCGRGSELGAPSADRLVNLMF